MEKARGEGGIPAGKAKLAVSLDDGTTLNFDVTGTTGDIDRGFSIRANAYNTQGQLIGTQTAFIDVRQFMGFESKTIQLDVDHYPTKLRLFPTEPI